MSECGQAHLALHGDTLTGQIYRTTDEEFDKRIKRIKRWVREANKAHTHNLVVLKIRGFELLFDFPEAIEEAYVLAPAGGGAHQAWLELAEKFPDDFSCEQVV